MKKQKSSVNNNRRQSVGWPDEGMHCYLPHTGCLVSVGSKHLTVGNGDHALLFRYADRNVAGWTYFVYDSAEQNAYTVDPAWLADRYQSKQFGRVVPVPVTADPDCRWFELLYFRADGTAFVWPGPEQTEFSWAEMWEWPVNVLNETPELMSYLGRIAFDQFNATLKNPLIDPDALEDAPLEFINGSQEELETVTRWICHSGVGKPEWPSGWSVTYSSPDATRTKEGGLLEWTFQKSASLRELFNLAYEYNTFTGYHWEYNDNRSGHQDSYDQEPFWITFEFRQPSHDEQREAKQELSRWLNGKMTAEEIQSLLGRADMP